MYKIAEDVLKGTFTKAKWAAFLKTLPPFDVDLKPIGVTIQAFSAALFQSGGWHWPAQPGREEHWSQPGSDVAMKRGPGAVGQCCSGTDIAPVGRGRNFPRQGDGA